MSDDLVIGLDVSKETVDCCLNADGSEIFLKIANNPAGFGQLADVVDGYQTANVMVCCEATNVYWRDIAAFFYARSASVSVVNPAIVRHYAKMQLKRVKTDKQDARLIAAFCRQQRPACWHPPVQTAQTLNNLYRRSTQINQMLTMEKNRLQTADVSVKHFIERTIVFLNAELAACRKQMQDFIDADDGCRHKQRILESITGIGRTTSQILLAVLLDAGRFDNARSLAGWLGLTPVIRNSGKFQGRARMSKMGDKNLRHALYMPAKVACTRSKLWRRWFDGHIERGKHPKQVYVLMMVKLVKYAYTCLKNDCFFDETRHRRDDQP